MRRQSGQLAREVAEASRVEASGSVLQQALLARFAKPGHADELVRVARQLERAQGKRRKLRAALKAVEADIKRCKREVKLIAAQLASGKDDLS